MVADQETRQQRHAQAGAGGADQHGLDLETRPPHDVDVGQPRRRAPVSPGLGARHQVQQPTAHDATRAERGGAPQQCRAAHRQQHLVEQVIDAGAGPVGRAEIQGAVQRAFAEEETRTARADVHGRTGLALVERSQPGHQPLRPDGGQRGDLEYHAAAFMSHDLLRVALDAFYGLHHPFAIHGARASQGNALLDAVEQPHAQLFFQQRDLPRHGAFGQRQLGRRAGDAEVAGGRVEGGQRTDAGQPASHWVIPKTQDVSRINRLSGLGQDS
ncbi:MAG: hypothetical protein ABS43_21590 [Bordetella sp. SCN 67-23]|nr:MAG: hypothetical protein ABS43_21590 [Bordetella sp. SCN 67-23]OJW94485.1 MAG: hypothetical protein BGO71_01110 [Burkholderiales bacterium 67-32]